ncbi:telomere repeats-binding bouquet formation protein 1 isoform X2 [Trachemys scripta elegans]|uniref:telomere repeats-binding bouquet formation protein 1 isoform X2 n=1 Tax=Trachemys scripta elegans TaxID=31138 RepID=UPI001555490A|nr:telomere repeats-binding bouquet formation protein 1 isoform X2 [Trachemys scripta elegans]
MENIEVQNTQCEMKTDLNLLLECLKYQMDSPASQKEALITIYSICQQNSDASDYFREIGGLMFVSDLAKSSVHCIVKEAALFTLAVVMENNVYCQQTLCTSELFEDLIFLLTNKSSSVNLKRMSVYVILVLVSNNKSGQTHIRETGCIGVLLQLFRTTLSISEMNLSDENINQYYQLWSSVCSTLCACVNNPQNEDNQNICCSVFPHAKDWLQSCIKPEIVRPICSFVGLTVANNSYVQEYFVSVGGLDILAEVLIKLVRDSSRSYSSAKLAVVVTKTLDACIADNSAVGDVLVKYHIVSKLLRLLTSDILDSGEKISIILTIGHCTEGCEENQSDLLKNNGLPLMIQLLTESQDEEVNKAATFVLQNCKQITEKLSLKINEYSLNLNDAEQLKMDLQIKERNLEDYWKKVKKILHRIELLEKEHDEETVRRQIFVDIPQEAVMQMTSKYHKMNASDQKANTKRTHTKMQCSQLNCKSDDLVGTTSANNQSSKNGILKTVNLVDASTRESEQNVTLHSADKLHTGSVQKSHTTNERTACEKKQSVPQASEHLFKQPSMTVQNLKQAQVAGCITVGLPFNSRNFSTILHTCPHQCDRHKVILEAEERYKRGLRKSVICNNSSSEAFKKILLTPAKKGRLNTESATFKSRKNLEENFQSIRLTPMKKTQSSISNIDDNFNKNINFREKYNLMPTYTKTLQTNQDTRLRKQTVKERHNTEYQGLNEKNKYSFDEDESTESLSLDPHARALKKSKRRIRKDFTTEEVNYLLSGVRKMGHHWNSILWSYPFQKGRTNVDLAKKYRKLQIHRNENKEDL